MRMVVALAIVGALAAPLAADEAGPTPWLGITYQQLGGGGAIVTEVHPGTPAAAAGLRRHDVLVSADGRPIRDLGQQIRDAEIGARFPLVIDRDGRRVLALPRLVARPTPDEILHLLLVGHDLPALPAFDEVGLTVRREAWRVGPMVVAVFDARCDACAVEIGGLVDELAARGVGEPVQVRALVLADSTVEFDALRALVPMPITAWRVERDAGSGLLGALDGGTDGAVLVTDRDGRIRYAAAVSSGALAHDGACQVVTALVAPR
ncbi:MAG: PDZ domain-containing protein [Myxococcales bacterium]|nr:PDZ domain-containing protein [Myxococcales bacterium]